MHFNYRIFGVQICFDGSSFGGSLTCSVMVPREDCGMMIMNYDDSHQHEIQPFAAVPESLASRVHSICSQKLCSITVNTVSSSQVHMVVNSGTDQ